MSLRSLLRWILAGLIAWHLAAWILPLAALLRDSAGTDPGELSAALQDALPVAWMTLKQAAASTVLALVLGAAAAWLLRRNARATGAAKNAVFVFLAFPFALPSVIAGLAALSWIGARGWLTGSVWPESLAYSMAAVVAVHAALNAPWAALRLLPALGEIPAVWNEAAATLGAGPWMRFRTILVPALSPVLLHSGLQIFCLSATSFALVLMLGGGPPVETLETLIYSRIRMGELDPAGALAAALLQFALLVSPSLLLAWLELRSLRRGRWIEAEAATRSRTSGSIGGALFAFVAAVLPWGVGLALPLLMSGGAGDVRGVFGELSVHFADSLAIAAPAALITVLLAFASVLLANSPSLGWGVRGCVLLLGVLPSGLSSLLLSLAFWRFWSAHVDPFEGSVAALVAIQSVIFLPLAVRVLAPAAARTPRRLLEAAALLGATPLQSWWRIEAPRWGAPLATSLLLVFGASMGEVAALSFFAGEGFSPLPLWLRELSARYEFGSARLVSVIFLAVLLAVGLLAAFLGARAESDEREGRGSE